MTTPRATLLPCGTRFRHERGAWSIEEPLTRLDHWIAFYKRLSERRMPLSNKPLSRVYGPDYAALKMLKREVESREKLFSDEVPA